MTGKIIPLDTIVIEELISVGLDKQFRYVDFKAKVEGRERNFMMSPQDGKRLGETLQNVSLRALDGNLPTEAGLAPYSPVNGAPVKATAFEVGLSENGKTMFFKFSGQDSQSPAIALPIDGVADLQKKIREAREVGMKIQAGHKAGRLQ
jgi:hypothetical protein